MGNNMAAASLPPLDKVDPAQAWQPWAPTPAEPWGLKWAGHLYRRATFGPSPRELAQAVKRGLPATLDLLIKGEPTAADLLDDLTRTGAVVARRNAPLELRGWWLYCMLHSGHPLREKLTLFWHNHFATSIGKVRRTTLMFAQNRALREHALGKFEPFLQAMSKDPALLLWLDSNSNVKGAPNENYARELMELFALGVGNYTERDVKEAARSFTGWHTDDDGFVFNAKAHDSGAKTVLGQSGNWKGDDVVRIVLKQPAAARFLVRKLYAYLISEAQDPPAPLLEPLAERFRRSSYDVSDLVRTMLSSRHFFSAHAYRQRIKGPVEYVLGAVRATVEGTFSQQVLVQRLAAMGQELFAPPNVKGWRGGPAWLNTATVLARQNFAQALAMGTLWSGRMPRPSRFDEAVEAEAQAVAEAEALKLEVPPPPAVPAPPGSAPKPPPRRPAPPEEPAPATNLDPARLVRAVKATSPEAVVKVLLDAYLPGGIEDAARAKLVAFVADGKPTGTALDRRVREAVHAILGMPECQLA
jgi:uncharacterized protein (DUF1800 family)